MAIENAQCGGSSAQVENEMAGLGKAVDRLEETLVRLSDHLCTVVMPEPAAASNASCPKSFLVPLAETIRVSRDRVDGLTDRVLSLLNRLEL